ncbi:hypothetical protein DEV91_1534 [Phyllobacterium brassicacearum]|nr:hypothetical protein DEV91_1534 [Phyllobacterium brassicacearum]
MPGLHPTRETGISPQKLPMRLLALPQMTDSVHHPEGLYPVG